MATDTQTKNVNGQVVVRKQDVEPISLSQWRANSRPLTIRWFDREVQFFYKPNVMDADHFSALKENEDLPISEWAVRYCARVLDVIPSICADDGSPLAITEENMRMLGTRMLNEMINAIVADLNPKAKTGSDSNDSSPQTDEKESSPGGTPQ